MRSVRIIPPLILLLLLAFPWACAQDPPPRLEVFLEGGGSFLNGGSGQLSSRRMSSGLPQRDVALPSPHQSP